MNILDPHQGHVAFLVSALSIVITLSLLAFALRHEKAHQAENPDDHH